MSSRILVVDDDAAVRDLVRNSLAGNAYEIEEAVDGEDGLRRFAAVQPDLVVLDWQMPGMSAPEVLTQLKKRDPRVPVVLLTASLQARHGALAGIYGADAFLTKPFRPLELLDAVERLLADRSGD